MLKKTAIFIVPALNYDGLHHINEVYKEDGSQSYLRKNMHSYDEQKKQCPNQDLMGVDLTRNYDY